MRAAVLADMQEINQRFETNKKHEQDGDKRTAAGKNGHRFRSAHVLVIVQINGSSNIDNQQKTDNTAHRAQHPIMADSGCGAARGRCNTDGCSASSKSVPCGVCADRACNRYRKCAFSLTVSGSTSHPRLVCVIFMPAPLFTPARFACAPLRQSRSNFHRITCADTAPCLDCQRITTTDPRPAPGA